MSGGDQCSSLSKLAGYLEENLRASQSAGLKFIDPRHLTTRLLSKQNHVVFGRRGTGKSTLVHTLDKKEEIISVCLNLEDFKDITFPNIILHILVASYKHLILEIKKKKPIYKFYFSAAKLRFKLNAEIKELHRLISEPDEEEQQVKTKSATEFKSSTGGKSPAVDVKAEAKQADEKEITRKIPVNKLSDLRTTLTKYKSLFSEISTTLDNEPIYLIFDDFYFIPKKIQPLLLDYFHRMSKGTNLFLKIATIKHRSVLYQRTLDSYVGIELNHDAFELDMDYTLDKFEDMQAFMKQLLESANEASNAKLNINGLFGGDGFSQLCLASGGVPRDFLTQFVSCSNHIISNKSINIGKVLVNEVAIADINKKLQSLRIDSGDETSILEVYLNKIREKVYSEKRTNCFLVAKQDMEIFQQAKQAIRELADLRLLHLVDDNTSSAPSDGRRYEAYILDIGLYENSRPRNFNQVDPGDADAKSRKDALRASPRLSLENLEKEVTKIVGIKIEVSESST